MMGSTRRVECPSGASSERKGTAHRLFGIVQIVTNGDTTPRSFNSYAYDEPGPVVVNEA